MLRKLVYFSYEYSTMTQWTYQLYWKKSYNKILICIHHELKIWNVQQIITNIEYLVTLKQRMNRYHLCNVQVHWWAVLFLYTPIITLIYLLIQRIHQVQSMQKMLRTP